MATSIIMSTSPCKMLILFSKFKNLGVLSKRLQASCPQQSPARIQRYRGKDIEKLKHLVNEYNLTEPGQKVLVLGAAPVIWSQYLAEKTNSMGKVGPIGLVVAMDINDFKSVQGVHILPKTDFMKESSQDKILSVLGMGNKFDCIFSAIKPPSSGLKSIDDERTTKMVLYLYLFIAKYLNQGGSCVIKIQGAEKEREIRRNAKRLFKTVNFLEAESAATSNPETYIIGKHFLQLKM